MTFAILPISHSYRLRGGNQCEWCLESRLNHQRYPKQPYCTCPSMEAVENYLSGVERKKEAAQGEEAA